MAFVGLVRALRHAAPTCAQPCPSALAARGLSTTHLRLAEDKVPKAKKAESFAELFARSSLAHAGPSLSGRLVDATILTANREVSVIFFFLSVPMAWLVGPLDRLD